jgi:tetratricopeptide (TPR) repeat protein
MLRRGRFFISLIVAVSVISCAPLVTKPPEEMVEAPEKKPPEKIPKTLEKGLGEVFVQKGREYETKEDLVAALRNYNLALTVDPLNHEALEGQNRLKIALHNLAEGHYKEGLRFHKEGKYGLARQEFLIALRLRPDYPEVINMFTSRKQIQIKRYLVHTIEPGESLSKVAQIYYGDYHKFPIIARYNNIADATKVYVGQEIKIPEIEGMEFEMGQAAVRTEKMEVPDSGSLAWEGDALETFRADQAPEPEADKGEREHREQAITFEEMDVSSLGSLAWEEEDALETFRADQAPEPEAQEGDRERVDQVAIYREYGIELFGKKDYQEALVEFAKVLNAYPEDHLALEYSYKSYFQNAMTLFENKDYLAARDQFQACLRYKHDCQECHRHIQASEDLYKELHYKRGMQLYHMELLHDAINEWELVKALDPNYKMTEYLINKANTILGKIEELKRSQNKGP